MATLLHGYCRMSFMLVVRSQTTKCVVEIKVTLAFMMLWLMSKLNKQVAISGTSSAATELHEF